MPILSLEPGDTQMINAAAQVLLRGFRQDNPDAWPTLESALEEVHECTVPQWISRVYINDEGRLVGWVAGRSSYDGHVWELHPLVVDPDFQGQGIGRALVQDFEIQAAAHGALTVILGTDDETNRTSLGGADVYPDIWRHIAEIKNLHRHPFEFYQKLGYVITGIVPDANGYGKPDIIMAKRVGGKGS